MIDLYQVLEIEASASSAEIKKAYRKLALRYHPDKVSEEERIEAEHKFKEISHAYEVLIDDEKRYHYDTYGTDEDMGYNGTNGNFSDNPFDNFFGAQEFGANDFHSFFNGMNNDHHRAHTRRPDKTEDAVLNVEITLEDLYNGKTIRSTSTRNIICNHCKGTGAKKNAVPKTCKTCDGNGRIHKITRNAVGSINQALVDCKTCKGVGKIYRTKDFCKKCKGEKVVEETKILEFEILSGSKSDDSIVLSQEADQFPGLQTGDVILEYTCKDHPTFERKGDDLYCKFKISLVDSLCGFSKIVVKHLDGRDIKVSTSPGKVIRPGDFIKIKDEGMPKTGKSWFGSSKGDLYIEIEIEFPKDNWFIEKNDLIKLKNVLPNDVKVGNDDIVEENIELITDFNLVTHKQLPTYEEETHPNGYSGYNDYEYQGAEPECRQQ